MELNTEKIIGLLAGVIIVIALVVSAINSVQTSQTLGNTTNETVALTGNVTGTLIDDDLIALDGLRNVTGLSIIDECNITLSTGILICNNTNTNTCYADYRYYPTEYIQATGARALFLISAILLVILVIFFVWRETKK